MLHQTLGVIFFNLLLDKMYIMFGFVREEELALVSCYLCDNLSKHIICALWSFLVNKILLLPKNALSVSLRSRSVFHSSLNIC